MIYASQSQSQSQSQSPVLGFELGFRSIERVGHGFAFACDANGTVAIDELNDSIRRSYLHARTVVGRELYAPIVIPVLSSGLRRQAPAASRKELPAQGPLRP